MRCTLKTLAFATTSLLIAAGCQHRPPVPLDLEAYATELTQRPLAIESIQEYAKTLAAEADREVTAFDLSDGLSLPEAEAVALAFNSDVRMARLAAEHAAQRAAAAGRWDDPELGLAGGRKRADGGTRAREVTIEPSADAPLGSSYTFRREAERTVDRAWVRSASLSITLPTSGRLRAERDAFASSHDAALLAVAETEWETLTALREHWLAWLAAKQRHDMLDAHLEVLAQFATMADALRDEGELLPADARLFAIELGHLEAQRDELASAIESRRMGILHLMGLLPDAPVELVASAPSGYSPPGIDGLAGRLAASHPVIARLRAEYQVAEDELRVELRRQYPDLTLSPAYTDERDETSLILGLGFPIPVWNANRLGIAEAAAARDMARARVEAAFEQALLEAAQQQRAWEGASARRARLTQTIAPMADVQLEELMALLRLGEVDMMMVHQALDQALDIKTALIDANADERLAAMRLLAAAGYPDENAPMAMEESDE